jgi:hypothetical protein
MKMYDRWNPGVGRENLMLPDPTWSASTAINRPPSMNTPIDEEIRKMRELVQRTKLNRFRLADRGSILSTNPWSQVKKELADRASQRVTDAVGPWAGQGVTPIARAPSARIPIDHGQDDPRVRTGELGMKMWERDIARQRAREQQGTAAPSQRDVEEALARNAQRERRELGVLSSDELRDREEMERKAKLVPDVPVDIIPNVTDAPKGSPMGILEAKDYETIDFVPPKQREELVETRDNSVGAVSKAAKDTSGNTVGGVDRAQEMERIWGNFAYDPVARKKAFLTQLNDIFMKSMLLDMVASLTGNRSQSAAYTKFALGRLEAIQKFDEEERLYNIYRGVYYREDGTFDAPKTKAEAFERVLGFGGTPDEAASISGHLPDKKDLVEWFRLTEDGTLENTFTEGKKSLPDPAKHGVGWSLKKPSIPTTKEGTAKTREYNIWQDMIKEKDPYADAYGRATGFIKRKEGLSVSTLWSMVKGISEGLVDFGEDQTLMEDWAKSKLKEALGIEEEEIQEEIDKEKESPAALGTRDNPIKVTSQEEFDALKHNQWYIDDDGLKQRKIK